MHIADHFFGTSGSRTARILIVGEAWGREEAQVGRPFVGQSGRELFRMLGEALPSIAPTLLREALSARSMHQWLALRDRWLDAAGIMLTNVVAAQPPGNDFTHFLYPTKDARSGHHPDHHGIYPRPQLLDGIRRLWALVAAIRPHIIIAAGNWPLHILTEHATPRTTAGYKLPTGIASWRGSQTFSRPVPVPASGDVPGHQLIPTLPIIHPAAILRDWSMRHVTVHDLRARLGRFLSGTLTWEAPSHNDIWRPTLGEVKHHLTSWLSRLSSGTELWLSVDIETYARRYISCIGFCDGDVALCIPMFYFDSSQRHVNYFSLEEEVHIWSLIRAILEHPNIRIVGQNFIYDTQYLWRCARVRAIVSGDTMVAHHVLYPGTPKDLAMLASLYNHSYCYWKDESQEWAASELAAEDLWRYNCKDTRSTREAWMVLARVLASESMESLYQDRLSQWELARDLTIQGVNQDSSLRAEMLRDLYWQLNPLESWLLGAVPEAWRYTAARAPWFTSSHATAQLLYHVLGIPAELHKKTHRPTTDDDALHSLCERSDTQWLQPLLTRLRDWRSAQVFKNNFLEINLDYAGRWPMQVNIAHPETFRWSTTKNGFDEGSNMQNLPKVED